VQGSASLLLGCRNKPRAHTAPKQARPADTLAARRRRRYATAGARGAVELLAARGLALLNGLAESDAAPFLDRVAGAPAGRGLAGEVAARALAYAALALRRPPLREVRPRSPGEGQLAVNALQVGVDPRV
jgi:hypothetical protein